MRGFSETRGGEDLERLRLAAGNAATAAVDEGALKV